MKFWIAIGLATTVFALHGSLLLAGENPTGPAAIARVLVYLAAEAAATISLAVASTKAHDAKRPLQLFALALAMWFVGDVIYELINWASGDVSYPGWPDLFYTLYFVPAFAAMPHMVRLGRRSGDALPVVDAAGVLIAVFSLIWYFVAGPLASDANSSVLARAAGLSLVLGDFAVASIAWWLVRFTHLGKTMAMRFLVSGLTGFVLCDTLYTWSSLHGDVVQGGVIDLLYVGSFMIVMLSGMRPSWQRMRQPTQATPGQLRSRLPLWMAFLALVPLSAAVASVLLGEDPTTEVVLIFASAFGTAAMVGHLSLVGDSNERVLARKAAMIGEQTRTEVENDIHETSMQELAAARIAIEHARVTGSVEQLDAAAHSLEEAAKRIRRQFDTS